MHVRDVSRITENDSLRKRKKRKKERLMLAALVFYAHGKTPSIRLFTIADSLSCAAPTKHCLISLASLFSLSSALLYI